MPEKTRKIIIAIAGVTVAVALIAILALSLGKNTDHCQTGLGFRNRKSMDIIKLPRRQKILLILHICLSFLPILALSLGKNTDYATLFTGLNQSEAQEVANLLQDQGVTYQYNESSGAIRVPAATVEQTRVNLLSQGYPKTGFACCFPPDSSSWSSLWCCFQKYLTLLRQPQA